MVSDPKGMVSWSLIAGQAYCPKCHQQIIPPTCAFTGCLWAYDGNKLDRCGKLQHFESKYRAVSDDKFHRSEENHNQVKWQMQRKSVLTARTSKAFVPYAGKVLIHSWPRTPVAILFTARAWMLGSWPGQLQIAPCASAPHAVFAITSDYCLLAELFT